MNYSKFEPCFKLKYLSVREIIVKFAEIEKNIMRQIS